VEVKLGTKSQPTVVKAHKDVFLSAGKVLSTLVPDSWNEGTQATIDWTDVGDEHSFQEKLRLLEYLYTGDYNVSMPTLEEEEEKEPLASEQPGSSTNLSTNPSKRLRISVAVTPTSILDAAERPEPTNLHRNKFGESCQHYLKCGPLISFNSFMQYVKNISGATSTPAGIFAQLAPAHPLPDLSDCILSHVRLYILANRCSNLRLCGHCVLHLSQVLSYIVTLPREVQRRHPSSDQVVWVIPSAGE